MWGGDDPFTHLLCVGPTRCGKSATILAPMMYQLLLQKKRGKKVGFSLIEPKGDLVRDVKEYCDVMEIPYVYIDPESPDSQRFNVLEGDTEDVAEATVAVLQSLFGKQEVFFQTVQESSTRNVTKLLKELKGDDLDLMDLLETLRDERLLEKRVQELKIKNPSSELLPFFENELLGSLKDQYRKLVIGLRSQVENITSNQKLRRIITGKSDINLDKHLEEGGVLLVNTSLGKLKTSGDAFGKFVIMHLQSATFRREGTERTRIPHFLIADEYSRYINPDVEIFLSIAASFRVAGIFATQSLAQLEVESGKISGRAMKQAILTNCRNKIAFCGLSAEDAKEFADEFGKDRVIMRQSTYKNRILLPRFFPDNYRDTEIEEYRYHYSYLQDAMKRFHFLCRIMKDGTPQRPFEGVGQFVPRNWKELREWEDPKDNSLSKKVIDFFSLQKKKAKKRLNDESTKKKQIEISATIEEQADIFEPDIQEITEEEPKEIGMTTEELTPNDEKTESKEVFQQEGNSFYPEVEENAVDAKFEPENISKKVENHHEETELIQDKAQEKVPSEISDETVKTEEKSKPVYEKYNNDNFF